MDLLPDSSTFTSNDIGHLTKQIPPSNANTTQDRLKRQEILDLVDYIDKTHISDEEKEELRLKCKLDECYASPVATSRHQNTLPDAPRRKQATTNYMKRARDHGGISFDIGMQR